jgi:hypothetical protein
MFNRKWFKKNQKILLWLLNTPITRSWFRYVLRINGKRSDVGKREISKIKPNAITWLEGAKISHSKNYKEIKAHPIYSTEFRTHDKFAKRIKYAFYPIWYLFHLWDILIANLFQPNWNLGFDSLTKYSETADATIEVNNAVWNTAHDATTGNLFDQTASYIQGEYNAGGPNYIIQRMFQMFDTGSELASDVVISAGVFSLYDSGSADSTNGIGIVQSTQATWNSIIAGDFDQCGVVDNPTEGATRISSFDANAYNNWTLNATGRGWIARSGETKPGSASASGKTQLGVRFAKDIDDATPTVRDYRQFYMADETGTTKDPKLVVTYTLVEAADEGIHQKKANPIQFYKGFDPKSY